MGVLFLLLLGAFVGWLSAAIADVDAGIFLRMIIGIIGAGLGEIVLILLTGADPLQHVSLLVVLFGAAGAAMLATLFEVSYKSEAHRSRTA